MNKVDSSLSEILPPELSEKLPVQVRGLRVIKEPSAQLCLACRAAKLLCGRPRCPILVRAENMVLSGLRPLSGTVDGVSPPGVFVGRAGYPKVHAGPLVAASEYEARGADTPESWWGMTMDEVISMRYRLIRGMSPIRVEEAADPPESLIKIQEMVLGLHPLHAELRGCSQLTNLLEFSDDVHPMGPSFTYSDIRLVSTGSGGTDGKLEKVYYDTDLPVRDALVQLYSEGVQVSKIQRALSLGTMGRRAARRLVPTRWSITAVDSLLSLSLIGRAKRLPEVSDCLVYRLQHFESTYVALIFPEKWGFEWVEAWRENTAWNPSQRGVYLVGDREDFGGRRRYAEPGGCYYSARLAAAEALVKSGRSGRVVILREIHPGYIMPLGVWTVREAVRKLFEQTPVKFTNPADAVRHAVSETSLNAETWFSKARLLYETVVQRRLSDFGE
ncbi:MAG: hypothetical protein QW767_02260 [Thermoprotei archaeon]